jgi:hypothetical protein
VQCISKITAWVDIYVAELSRVLFLKDNMTQKSQWLSIFYSLCIQSYVRKVLVHLSSLEAPVALKAHSKNLRFEQYLHLGIRLFTAASGNYDPIMGSYSTTSEESETDQAAGSSHYRTAQLSLRQSNWENDGVSGSYDYLKRIFEDFGATLEGNPNSVPDYTTSFAGWSSTEEVINPPLFPDPNSQTGGFPCNYPGCIAQPFQTQVGIHNAYLKRELTKV